MGAWPAVEHQGPMSLASLARKLRHAQARTHSAAPTALTARLPPTPVSPTPPQRRAQTFTSACCLRGASGVRWACTPRCATPAWSTMTSRRWAAPQQRRDQTRKFFPGSRPPAVGVCDGLPSVGRPLTPSRGQSTPLMGCAQILSWLCGAGMPRCRTHGSGIVQLCRQPTLQKLPAGGALYVNPGPCPCCALHPRRFLLSTSGPSPQAPRR